MSRPEGGISPEAKTALINCNTQSGAIPQGTPIAISNELQEAGLIRAAGMTNRGRAARGRLIHARLEEL